MNKLFKLGRVTEETMDHHHGTWCEADLFTATTDPTKTGVPGCKN